MEQLVAHLNYGLIWPDREAKFIRNLPHKTPVYLFEREREEAWDEEKIEHAAQKLAEAMVKAPSRRDTGAQWQGTARNYS
jgi:hypothetical protein